MSFSIKRVPSEFLNTEVKLEEYIVKWRSQGDDLSVDRDNVGEAFKGGPSIKPREGSRSRELLGMFLLNG